MKKISLPIQTLFSDLEQTASEAEFLDNFDKSGSFKKKKRRDRYYWYFQTRIGDEVKDIYVGPVTDKNITDKVQNFNRLKSDFNERREIVNALIRAGLPRTDASTGGIIEALAKAGFFRLRGVLIGTTAYQCYSGILGVVLDASSLRTQDADLAQYLSIARLIDDESPPILDVLQSVDPSFESVSHLTDSRHETAFVNSRNYRVEFLTPNRGSEDYEGIPVRMPALGNVSAIPLRFLDYLIYNPIRSVLLFEGGIPVTIPAPERYAIHKLIISDRRKQDNYSKIGKDLVQAASLIEAMSAQRSLDLAAAWFEAWGKGPKWKLALASGVERLEEEARDKLNDLVLKNAKRLKQNPDEAWPAEL